MCAIFYIQNKEITDIQQLKEHVDPIACLEHWAIEQVESFKDTDCLCYIDPLVVAMKLGKKVLSDVNLGFYTFKD